MNQKILFRKMNPTSLLAIILIITNTIYLIDGIRTAPMVKNGEIGITFFPIIVSILLYLAAIFIFISGAREENGLFFRLSKISKPGAIVIITLIYVLIFKELGYLLSSILYVFSLMFLFEEKSRSKKSNLLNIVYSFIIVLLIYLLYQKLFGVRLPVGEVF